MMVIVVGKLLVTFFSTLIAWCGLRWHIGFTVQNRYTWGLRGSYIPLLQRILLNFIWCAIQCEYAMQTDESTTNQLRRLERRSVDSSMYHSDMAVLCEDAQYATIIHANHDISIRWLRPVLGLVSPFPVRPTREIPTALLGHVNILWSGHAQYDDLVAIRGQRCRAALDDRANYSGELILEPPLARDERH